MCQLVAGTMLATVKRHVTQSKKSHNYEQPSWHKPRLFMWKNTQELTLRSDINKYRSRGGGRRADNIIPSFAPFILCSQLSKLHAYERDGGGYESGQTHCVWHTAVVSGRGDYHSRSSFCMMEHERQPCPRSTERIYTRTRTSIRASYYAAECPRRNQPRPYQRLARSHSMPRGRRKRRRQTAKR